MHARLPRPARRPFMTVTTVAFAVMLAACSTPTTTGTPAADGSVAVEGRVASVDTSPWAYDGNAVMVVDTTSGPVRVQLPARWNLCRATGLDTLDDLAAGDRVRAVGARDADGSITVCEGVDHLIVELPAAG